MTATSSRPGPLGRAGSAGSDRPQHHALAVLARIGLVARGVVYGVIGFLALKLALGDGGRTESQNGALQTVAHQTLGQVLLIALAVGFAAYAVWRLAEAAGGTRRGDEHRLRHRVAAVGSAGGYAVLCYTALEILGGSHRTGGSPKHAAAGILGWPGGPMIVGIAGLVIIGAGGYQAYKGVARKFMEDSRAAEMPDGVRVSFTALGVIGHVARAVTFALVGYGLTKAALDYSAKQAVGLDGALQKLAHASDGPLLLGIVAAGFIAFALYSIADARYHRV